MSDPITADENGAPRQPAVALTRAVRAVFEDGVIKPAEPLDLPAGAALDLHIALRVTAVAAPGEHANGRDQAPARGLTITLPDSGIIAALAQREARRLAAIAVSGVLALVVLRALRADPPLASYNWMLLPWAGSIALFLLACAPSRPSLGWRGCAGALARRRALALALGAITLAALGLRVLQLGGIPPTLSGDEGSQGFEAIRILRGEIRHPFTTGWLGVPTLSFYFNAPTIALLGNTIAALRLPWALLGTATIPVAYFLAARLQGQIVGLATAALLAAYDYHIHFSRLGSNQIADGFFVALALLLLYRGYDRRSPLDWALCGAVVGVAQFFYAGARFTVLIAGAATLVLALRDGRRFWREQRWGPPALCGAALIAAAPMIQYALRFPDDYNARLNVVGILQSGWLQRAEADRQQGPLPVLWDQFQRAALAFNFYHDRTVWYGAPKPLFGLPAAALFVLGLGYATVQPLERRLAPMVAWWWGATILGGMLTVDPPSSQRLITLAVPAVFFVALALDRVGRLLLNARANRPSTPPLAGFLAVIVVAIGASSIWWYFVKFTPLRIYGSTNAMVATELGKYAHTTLGPHTRIYFFGAPRMVASFGSMLYLAPEIEHADVLDPLAGPPARGLIPADMDAAFVFLPERRADLDLVLQAFPGGELSVAPSPLGGDPLYWLYRVPRERLAW
jgi:4-amino-4-deoxy-L-arabinose transferase-like glycosyltransferase